MKQLIFLWFTLIWLPFTVMATEPTSNDVYQKVYQISQEVQIIKRHFHIDKVAEEVNVTISLTPGHSWQKAYEILYKIDLFRQKHGLSFISVPSREPLLKLMPMVAYEQMERIITELRILKYYLDITEEVATLPTFTGKVPTDVYNLLNHISSEMDILNGKTLTPSDALTQAVRISEDINFILEALGIKDTVIPPKKNVGVLPSGSFENLLLLLTEIARLKSIIEINEIDFHIFTPKNRQITPSDVFSIGGIALAELQPIKAYLGLKYALTPMAEHYENIEPADVQQLAGWSIRKLQLIRSINKK